MRHEMHVEKGKRRAKDRLSSHVSKLHKALEPIVVDFFGCLETQTVAGESSCSTPHLVLGSEILTGLEALLTTTC